MALVRFVLGKLILFFNWLFTPRSVVRAPAAQAAIDQHTASLVLYQYEACPFCVKVRRAMQRHALKIETQDVKRNQIAREELLAGGGELQVPLLPDALDEPDATSPPTGPCGAPIGVECVRFVGLIWGLLKNGILPIGAEFGKNAHNENRKFTTRRIQ